MKTIRKFPIAAAVVLMWPFGLFAADSETATGGLQEIVVTAQKRVEDVDKVPISISVFDQAQMDLQGVRDIEDIYQMTPGVNFQQRGEFSQLSIRGISSGGGGATAGIYIDDVPVQIRNIELNLVGSATPNVFDLDRVEILRGPQGTYFGAGAEAGAIRFITPQPSVTENSGYTREGFNSINNGGLGYEAGVAVGGPIVPDELGYRVSANYQQVGGYIDHYSTVPGGINQADSNWSQTGEAKAALLFRPTENVKITPQIFFENVDYHDLSAFDPNLSDPSTGTYVNGGLLGTPGHNQLILPQLKFEIDMGPVALTSISAYLYRHDQTGYDYSILLPMALGQPLPTIAKYFTDSTYENLQKNLSQEIRLQNSDPNAKLKWVAGGWYSVARQETIQNDVEPNLNAYNLQYFGKTTLQLYKCCAPGQLGSVITGSPSGLLEPGNYSNEGDNNARDRQLAGFAQVDWEFISHLTLTAGVRYAKQSNDFDLLFAGPITGGAVRSSGSESENVTTPKFGLSYQIDNKNMVYASASKGNRLGGGNSPFAIFPGCLAQLAELGVSSHPGAYTSDFLWNYEIGTKNRLFDDRVQIEASAFHMNWTNLQQEVYVPLCATSFTANIGRATSDGFDLQINAVPTDHVKLGLAVGYDNAKIAETTGIPGGTTFVNKGDQIDATQSPWNVTAQVEYDFMIFSSQKAYARVDDEFHSKNPGPFTFQNADSASYSPLQPVNPSQNLINLRLGTITHGWDVALFGTNLANAHPLLNVTILSQLAPVGHDYTLTPRTIGVTGNYRW